MSLIVGPSGARVFANPMEGEMETAATHLRRRLAAATHGVVPFPILDARGEPMRRPEAKGLPGLAAWLPTGPPSPQFLAKYGPRRHYAGCREHPRHAGRCPTDPEAACR